MHLSGDIALALDPGLSVDFRRFMEGIRFD
jgi:hypothetical protein